MKLIATLVFMFTFYFMFSQLIDRDIGRFEAFSGFTRIDYASFKIPEEKNEIEGNIYVFENWTNRGILKIGKNEFKLSNINFNMRTNKIESRVGKDSVYIFDLTNVDHIFINNRKFKNYYFSNQNEILEVVYDGDDFKMLKDYKVDVKRGEVDPLMVKKKVAKFYTNTFYYIKKGNDFKKIKLKKKYILLLFDNKSNLVSDFVKENKLSYKSEKDVKKKISYYESL